MSRKCSRILQRYILYHFTLTVLWQFHQKIRRSNKEQIKNITFNLDLSGLN